LSTSNDINLKNFIPDTIYLGENFDYNKQSVVETKKMLSVKLGSHTMTPLSYLKFIAFRKIFHVITSGIFSPIFMKAIFRL
jgi:hypothetical protein